MFCKPFLKINNFRGISRHSSFHKQFSTQRVRIGIIPGDGIGEEVVSSAKQILVKIAPQFTGNPTLDLVNLDAGWGTFERTGNSLPDETVKQLKNCDGALFGAVSSPTHKVQGYSSPIIGMRKALDLYANLRPIISAPIASSRENVDILIVRENTECLYVKKERIEDNGNTVIADRVITRSASLRIAEMAFTQARERAKRGTSKKSLVTIVHKSNVLSLSDGLFRDCCFEVSKKYPDVPVEEQIVDSMVYKLILEPEKYDVIVAPNLYGDILSDAAAALVGGLGLAPSANVGDSFALCEAVHGSAPDIAGKGIANPIATIRALALLLEQIPKIPNGRKLSAVIQQSITSLLAQGPLPRDLGGNASTKQITEEIEKQLDRLL